MDEDRNSSTPKSRPSKSGFTIPLEDVAATMLVVAYFAGIITLCHRWLALPFWASCLASFGLLPAIFVVIAVRSGRSK